MSHERKAKIDAQPKRSAEAKKMAESWRRLEAGGRYEVGDYFPIFGTDLYPTDEKKSSTVDRFIPVRVASTSETTTGGQLVTTVQHYLNEEVTDAKTWRAQDLQKFTKGERRNLTEALQGVESSESDRTVTLRSGRWAEDLRRQMEPQVRFNDSVQTFYETGDYEPLLHSLIELVGINLNDIPNGPELFAVIEHATAVLRQGELDAVTVRDAQVAIEQFVQQFDPEQQSAQRADMRPHPKYQYRLNTATRALIFLLRDLHSRVSLH